jgi:alpha-1,2-mannosyltransferase
VSQTMSGRHVPDRQMWVLGFALVFCTAFLARLVPLLNGGGLYAAGNYDDGVHYAVAMGLVHGLLPYRDFLFLHAPGIALLLAPFAALADVIGEPHAMLAARLCWIALGGLNAVLSGLVLAPLGRLAAMLAGLMYALFFGAIYAEHTVLLEPPATTMLLLALVITRALGSGEGRTTRHYVAAGLLLGLSPALKIWGVLAVLVVAGGLAYHRSLRHGVTVLLSAVASCTVVCLPFFLAAPGQMWMMVVADQLGRRRNALDEARRIDGMLGLSLWTGEPRLHLGTALVIALALAALVVCLIRPQLRLLAALLITHVLMLAITPAWFLHYAGVIAAPLVLVLGGGLAVALTKVGTVPTSWLPPAVATLAVVVVMLSALPLTQLRLDRPFPGRAAAAVLADRPGCIVTDFPMALIQMNLLRRNLDRGCRYEVDLSGASYHLEAGGDMEKSRARNRVWQAYALEYLRSGQASIIVKFSSGVGFSPQTARVVRSWPKIGKAGDYTIREPQSPPAPMPRTQEPGHFSETRSVAAGSS